MTHKELTEKFVSLGLSKGDLVTITLTDGKAHVGELSSGKVSVEVDDKGDYKEDTSRLGLLPPPPSPGKVFAREIQPVYSKNINSIEKF